MKSKISSIGFIKQLEIQRVVFNKKVSYIVLSGPIPLEEFKGFGSKSKAINWARDFYNDESLILEK